MSNGHSDRCAGAPCACERQRYTKLLGIAVFLAIFEGFGGYYSGSLANLADAGHVAADALGILVGMAVAEAIRRGKDERKWRALGCVVNAKILDGVAVAVLIEARLRLQHPHAATGWAMLAVAIVGLAGNYLQHRMLDEVDESERHSTHRAMSAHVLGDLALSVVAVTSGGLVWATGVVIIDPLLSLLAAGLLFLLALRTARDGWREWRDHNEHSHHGHSH